MSRPRRPKPARRRVGRVSYYLHHGGWHLWAWRHDRAARRALAERDFGRARAHFLLCLEVWPDSGETHRQAARAAWRAGTPDEAVRHLDRCEQLGVPRDVVLLERALVRASRGDLADVEAYLLPRGEGEDPEAAVPDLGSLRYVNRELSALDYASRVLAVAEDGTRPVLERARFCAIFASNALCWISYSCIIRWLSV